MPAGRRRQAARAWRRLLLSICVAVSLGARGVDSIVTGVRASTLRRAHYCARAHFAHCARRSLRGLSLASQPSTPDRVCRFSRDVFLVVHFLFFFFCMQNRGTRVLGE